MPVYGKGIVALPLSTPFASGTGPPPDVPNAPSVELVTLWQPVSEKVVEWEIERVGDPPNLPTPKPEDSSWKLVDVEYAPMGIELLSDGVTPIYRISGSYTYIRPVPETDTPNIPMPMPDWINYNPQDAVLGQNQYSTGIIDYPKGGP